MIDDLIGGDLYGTMLVNVGFITTQAFKAAELYSYYGSMRVRNKTGLISNLYGPGCEPEFVMTCERPFPVLEVKKPELIVKFVRYGEEINTEQVKTYKAIPSVKAILQVSVTDPSCIVWQQILKEGWTGKTCIDNDEIYLYEWNIKFNVMDFYTNTVLAI